MLELLYEALASEFGVRVQTSNLNTLRQKLYALRAQHEELSCLALVQSPFDPNELWIVKKGNSDGQESS